MKLVCPMCGSHDMFFKKKSVDLLQVIKGDGTLLNRFENLKNPNDTEYLECTMCHYKGDIREFQGEEK